MAYAATTKVPVSQTKAEIERLVNKNGAENFGIMNKGFVTIIAFTINGINIMFKFEQAATAQEERSVWRAVMMTIKMKFESIEREIETFEEAFLAQVVAPDGRTYGEHVIPAIAVDYSERRIPLLPQF